MTKVETMAGYLNRITFTEQVILCRVIRAHSERKYAHLTPALLPFVPMQIVHHALVSSRTHRPIAVLIAKLGRRVPFEPIMWLDKKKVRRVFGPDPSKGRRFNWLPKHSPPIDPLVCLKNSVPTEGHNSYHVVVHPAYRTAVMLWLADNLV